MNKTPSADPVDDEMAADLDYLHENYERYVAHQTWQSALDWARKGDFKPMIECLRQFDLPLDADDVRTWLADGLAKGFKKPRKTTKRPNLVLFFLDDVGSYVDERHLSSLQMIKRVRELQKQGRRHSEAIAATAVEFGTTDQRLGNLLRRPLSHWGLRNPRDIKRMFAGILPAKE